MGYESLSASSHASSVSELVEKAFRHWEAGRQATAAGPHPSPPASLPFTIALSGEVGTQSTAVATEVGRRLGWHAYDHELLERIAGEMGLRTALLESIDERRQSWLQDSIGASLAALVSGGGVPRASESSYVHHLVEVVHALGAHGECVIVGRGAAFILPPQTTLRVRLVGPVRERVRALARRLDIPEREAALRVRDGDRKRNEFIHDHFLKDPADADNYDLIINSLRLPVAQVAGLVVAALEGLKERKPPENSGEPTTR